MMRRRNARTALARSLAALVIAASPLWALAEERPLQPAEGGVIGLPMMADPAIAPPPQSRTFHPRLKLLWEQALRRPEAELRRQAAEAFARAARTGMPDMANVVPVLVQVLESDPSPSVRQAAASALVAIDDPSAAPAALAASTRKGGVQLATIVDPALARWDHRPAVAVWTQRVGDPQAPEPVRVSAAGSLAAMGAEGSVDALLRVALDGGASPQLRLAAARALGDLTESGLVDPARSLAGGTMLDRVLASELVAGHSRGDAEALLMELAADDDPAVAAAATHTLNRVDTAALASQAGRFVGHPDARVREAVIRAVSEHPGDASVEHLATLLADPVLANRMLSREGLIRFARESGLDAQVRSAASGALAGADWRALEQSALLLGELDHEAAASRLVELARHDRAEVRLAAVTALRRVAVADTLPELLRRAEELTEQSVAAAAEATGSGATRMEGISDETAQIFQLFGELRYEAAAELLRRYVPKQQELGAWARGAAVYALGKIHEGKPADDLIAQFASRLSDVDPMNPEMPQVRRFAAVGLGRMGARQRLDVLRRFYEEENATPDIGGASRWAIMEITGDALPELASLDYRETGWFLQPTN